MQDESSLDSSRSDDSGQDTTDPRAAMRAFLQRAEVRLSTMHRVGGVFLNGAGLLVLFPVFFTSAIQRVVEHLKWQVMFLLTAAHNLSSFDSVASAIPLLASLLAMCVSIGLPLYALFLLVRDIVSFYFTSHHYGFFNERWFHPRFILSGLAFSPDESPATKDAIFSRQREPSLIHFLLPFDMKRQKEQDAVIEASKGSIIPSTRRHELKSYEAWAASVSPEALTLGVDTLRRFHAQFGLAGVVDHDLVDQVAKIEVSLVRHALTLRRMVLRYFKAVILFMWTTIVSIGIGVLLPKLPELDGSSANANGWKISVWGMIVLCVGYVGWSIPMGKLVSMPVKWIHEYGDHGSDEQNVDVDPHLTAFETRVRWWRNVVLMSWIACAGVALLVHLVGRAAC